MIDSESVRYSLQKNTVEAKRLAREIKAFDNAKRNLAADMRKAQCEMSRRLKRYQDRLREIQLTRSRDYSRYHDGRETSAELSRRKLRKASKSGRVRPVTAPAGRKQTVQEEEDEATAVKNWEMIMQNRRKSKVDLRPQTSVELFRASGGRQGVTPAAARRGSGSTDVSLSSSLSSSRDSELEVFALATPHFGSDVTSARQEAEAPAPTSGRRGPVSAPMGTLIPRHTPRGTAREAARLALGPSGEASQNPDEALRISQSARGHRPPHVTLKAPVSARAGTRISSVDGTRYFDEEEMRMRGDIYGSLLEQRKRQEQVYYRSLCQRVEEFCRARQPEASSQLDYYSRSATARNSRRPPSGISEASVTSYHVITDEELNKKILPLRNCPFYSWS